MAAQTLRELARDFAKGVIDRENYRRQRTILIDGIVSGAVKVDAIEFAPPVGSTSALDSTHPGRRRNKEAQKIDEDLDFFDITQVVAPSSETTQVVGAAPDITPPRPEIAQRNGQATPSNGTVLAENRILLMGIGVGILLLLAIGIALVLGLGKSGSSSRASDSPTSGTAASVMAEEPATAGAYANMQDGGAASDAIVEFLRTKNWSDESMQQFTATWQALPQPEREAAADSAEMLQMANAIYRKLLELRALARISDDAASVDKESRLLEFARNLGITDSRLTREESAGPG